MHDRCFFNLDVEGGELIQRTLHPGLWLKGWLRERRPAHQRERSFVVDSFSHGSREPDLIHVFESR